MKEAFLRLEEAAKKMNLQINQNKTKYMPVTRKDCANGPVHIEIGPYKLRLYVALPTLDQKLIVKMTSAMK
jgi:hypothetical protein